MACMPPSLPSSHQSSSSACLTVLYIHTYTHTAAAVAAAVAVASTLVMGPPKKASLPPPSLSAPSHLCCCSISCHPTFLPSSGSSCHHTTHTTPLALLVITPPTPHLWLFLSSHHPHHTSGSSCHHTTHITRKNSLCLSCVYMHTSSSS